VLALSLVAVALIPASGAGASSGSSAASTLRISGTLADSITASMPFLRLTFSGAVKASSLPPLAVTLPLATTWQQIGPRQVQAVADVPTIPGTTYSIGQPEAVNCGARCTFRAVRTESLTSDTSDAWVQQLLATLGYLPAHFTPLAPAPDAAQSTSGVYAWAYPHLPASLSSLWSVGNNNVIVRGALMAFQNNNELPTTGLLDAATWHALVKSVRHGTADPNTYNYVAVSQTSPEMLHLYVAGREAFHTLVNTGISVAPTQAGTYPVYERFVTTTMSGFNPDGTHYSDPGIPWVSYFHGGDALHGFIRASYGWPQSLGCVEMPFSSAQAVWPHTPIGTLVTIEAT